MIKAAALLTLLSLVLVQLAFGSGQLAFEPAATSAPGPARLSVRMRILLDEPYVLTARHVVAFKLSLRRHGLSLRVRHDEQAISAHRQSEALQFGVSARSSVAGHL